MLMAEKNDYFNIEINLYLVTQLSISPLFLFYSKSKTEVT